MIKLRNLVSGISGVQLSGNIDSIISSVVYDSRQAVQGSLFVALKGGYADGHCYLADARSNGALAAVVSEEQHFTSSSTFDALARVPDTRLALAQVARQFYGSPASRLTVVGVTGTDGKTSTSFFIEHILRETSVRTGMLGTVAIRIPGLPDQSANRQTTPESLEVQRYLSSMLEHEVEVAILESTSHGLEMHRVDGCEFDVGVVTNVTHEHLDFHGSISAYRVAKAKLLQKVAETKHTGGLGVVVLNADDPGTVEIAAAAGECRRIWFSSCGNPTAEIQGLHQLHRPEGSSFSLVINDQIEQVTLQIPGQWSVDNALAAAGAATALGVPPADIAAGLSGLTAIPGRMESVVAGQPFSVIVDYAHTPESLRAVLSEVRSLTNGRVLVMFGSAGERDIEKRSMQGSLAAELADFAVFTSEDPRYEEPSEILANIADGALKSGWRRDVDFVCIENRRTATLEVLRNANPNDVVVLAGKGHERSIIYRDKHHYWNEADEARQALAFLGYSENT